MEHHCNSSETIRNGVPAVSAVLSDRIPANPNTAPAYPDWLWEFVQEQAEFIENLSPFPFDQPSDIRPFLSVHQNDYLRLANHPQVVEARRVANSRHRIESFSSPVFGGASEEHEDFTALLADSMQAGQVILTTAGWTANVGLLEAIAKPDMPVYIDAEAHASMVDGIRFARARKLLLRHNDPTHLEQRVKIHGPGVVCIDALYSTDGSLPELEHYVAVCARHQCCLILDEAHSFGMFGERGGGLAVMRGLAQDVHFRTISLSKALGGHGGAIAGAREIMRTLCTRMRPVLFSSATSAVLAAGHRKALELLVAEPERATRCLALAGLFRARLRERGIDTAGSASQIVSIYFQNEDACRLYGELRANGILTSVFVYPAVPKGISLTRFSFYSELTEDDTHRMADCVIAAMSRLRPAEVPA